MRFNCSFILATFLDYTVSQEPHSAHHFILFWIKTTGRLFEPFFHLKAICQIVVTDRYESIEGKEGMLGNVQLTFSLKVSAPMLIF